MCVIICQLPVGSLVVAVDKEIGELLPGHSKIFPTIPCGPWTINQADLKSTPHGSSFAPTPTGKARPEAPGCSATAPPLLPDAKSSLKIAGKWMGWSYEDSILHHLILSVHSWKYTQPCESVPAHNGYWGMKALYKEGVSWLKQLCHCKHMRFEPVWKPGDSMCPSFPPALRTVTGQPPREWDLLTEFHPAGRTF